MVRKRVARFLALFLSIGMLTTSVPVSATEVTTYPVDAEEEIEESTQGAKESEDENSDENEESKKEDSEDKGENPDSENRETDISDKDSENPEKSDVEEDSEAEDESDEEDLDEPETEQDAEEETPAVVDVKTSISENSISVLTTSEDGFEWAEDGTTITKYTGKETEITIPAKATAIGEGAFKDNTDITSVTFEENSQLQTIGEAAFRGCTNLQTAIIPENVTNIGKEAYYGCTGLSTIEIESTNDINCGCEEVDYSNLPNGIFTGCQISSIVFPDGITKIPANMFMRAGFAYDGFIGKGTGITIPASVTEIGENAFYCAGYLTSVEIAADSEITTIGQGAFYGIDIESIEIPEKVTKIGKEAFCRCDKLSTVVIKSTQDIACDYDTGSGDGIFDYCNITTVTFPEGMKKIPANLFADADFAEDGAAITIPASVTEIGDYAFHCAMNLTSVNMENCSALTKIGEGAFWGIDITSIIIPENVTNIEEGAFGSCKSLSTVDLRSTNDIRYEFDFEDKDIFNGAFNGCNISTVKFPEGITKIPAYMFASAGFAENAEITIPASVTEIGNYAFSWTDNLTGIKVTDGSRLTTIGDWAFNCSGLKNLKLPESVQKIGADAFAACHSMESAVIPKNVTTIGKSAFNSCSKLASVTIESRNLQLDQFPYDSMLFLGCNIGTLKFSEGITTIPAYMFASAGFAENAEVTIPASVTEIGSYAFDNVVNLKKVAIAEGSKLTTIGESAFEGTAIESIIIPENVTKIGDGAFDECANLSTVDIKSIKNITVDGYGVFVGCSISTVTFPEGMKTIPAYMFASAGFAENAEITIPASVTEIGSDAFCKAEKLTKVTIEDNSKLTTIGDWAFSKTAIESIIIPENVTYIGVGAFDGCSNLSTVEIKSKKNITVDGYGMFADCNISTVTFPEGIKAIPAYMFSDAGFASETKLEIPSGVTTINKYAFAWMKGLKSIYIPASVTKIDSTAFKGVEELEVHCISGSAAETMAKNKGYTVVASYGITYNLGGGENNASNPLSYKTGDTLTLSPATRKGYEFAGWYTDKGYQNRITGEEGGKFTPTDSMRNLTLYAKWILNKYSITYDYNEGQASSKANPSGYDVSKDYILYAPSRSGYAFVGWQVNDTEELITGNKIAKGTYAEDLELTAVWREYAYSLEYNKNAKDAAGTMESIALNYSQKYILSEEGFSRAGYDFTGWNTRADGKGVSYQPGDEVSGLSAKDKARVILYAQWQERPFEIIYVMNGGTNHAKNPESYRPNVTVRLQNPTREGYTFTGWYTDSSFENKITGITKNQGDVTVYADWIENSYTIKYDKNKGVCPSGESMSPEKISYTEEKELAANVFERTGYDFVGWNTQANGKGTAYEDEATVSRLSAKNNGTVTLYAQWKAVEVPITYELNDGVNAAANPETVNITKDVKLKNPTRTGYTFAGWYTDEEFQNKVTVISRKTTDSVTVYAKWNENTYKLKFDSNGGTVEIPAQATYLYTDTVTLPDGEAATRNQYSLTGWNTKKDRSGVHYDLGADYSGLAQKGTVTLYAEWTPDEDKTYQITYENIEEGDRNMNPDSYSFEKDVKLSSPVREGYTFNGWYTDEEFTSKKVTVIRKTEKDDKILYAKWTENQYTVKFNANKGTLPKGLSMKPMTVKYTEPTGLTKNEFVRSGYQFTGWNSKANGTGEDYSDEQSVEGLISKNKGTVTLYAQWKPVAYSVNYEGVEDGDNSGNPDSYTVEKDVKLVSPVRRGYTFKGWYTNDAYTKKVTGISRNTKAEVTLYAKWEENRYTVRFSLRGGNASIKSIANRGYTDEITLPDTEPVKEGMNFAGWALNAGETALYQPGETISFADIYEAGGTDKGIFGRYFTLYAVWEESGEPEEP